MKLSAAAATATAVLLTALSAVDAQSACSSVITRKELLSLTPSEWSTMKGVLSAMQRDGWFAWFAYLHNQNFGQIHGNSQFFPFHRRFVQDWESVARRYNSGYAQPYWDEMRDYRQPAASQVLTSNWLGGNGQGSGRCVQNGNQAGWTMTYPNNHCFSRDFGNNGNPTAWYSPEYIQSFIQRDTSMAQFRPDIEYSLHGVVHINIGGDMYQTHSPNDFIFMLHHANIDRLWWQWQKNGHLWTMDGPNYDNSPTTVDSNIAAYNEPIRTVMRLGYGNACYQYDSDPIGTPARKRDLGHLTNTVANLPSKLVEKWFPKTYKSNPKPATVVAAAIAPPNGKTIPYPTTLTPEWIKMHKYNLDDVKRVESDAKEFVDDMRSAGYKSPV